MANGIYTAVSGAVAQTNILETVANNLANISTAGFKTGQVSFAEVLAKSAANGRKDIGSFVRPSEIRMDLRPGTLRPTENPMDVALEGKGFLCLQEKNEVIFSRGGAVQIRADGVLADMDGRALLGRNNKVLRPGLNAGALTIGADGTVETPNGTVGVLKVVEFDQPALLQRLGGNRMSAPPAAGERAAKGTQVRQGYLELSNVNPVSEISSMIVASRAYETLHRLISTFRDIDTRSANDLGQER